MGSFALTTLTTMNASTDYLGQRVRVVMDRPLGSRHSEHGFFYPMNYGYIPGTHTPDGAPIDAYVLGVSKPLHCRHRPPRR